MSISILFTSGFVSLLSIVAGIIIARWLGPAQLGLFYIVNLIPTYGEKFGRIGMVDNAATYFLGQKKYAPAPVLGHITAVLLIFSFLTIVAFYFLIGYFKLFFIKSANIPDYYLWIMIFSLPSIFLYIGYTKMLVTLDKIKVFNVMRLVRGVLFLLLCLFFWGQNWDFLGACISEIFSTALMVIVCIVVLKRSFGFSFKPNLNLLKDLLGYSWKIYTIATLTFFHHKLDILFVAFLLDSSQVAFYSLAVGISWLLLKLPDGISGLLYARISREQQEQATQKASRLIRVIVVTLSLSALALAILIYPTIVFFYGKEFLPLLAPFFIVLPGVVALGAARIMADYFLGQGHPRFLFRALICAVPLNILLNMFAIPRFGIMGAAVVSLFTYFLYMSLLVYGFWSLTRVPPSDLFLIKKEDCLYLKNALKDLF